MAHKWEWVRLDRAIRQQIECGHGYGTLLCRLSYQNYVLKFSQHTFRLFGCCFNCRACFLRNSRSARCMYSCWLLNSVSCWRCTCSSRSWCTAFCWRYSSSCVFSWCLSSIEWACSSCCCRLFSSCTQNNTVNNLVFPFHLYSGIRTGAKTVSQMNPERKLGRKISLTCLVLIWFTTAGRIRKILTK